MVDWLNPTREMLSGRDAGRNDRQNEIDDLDREREELKNAIAAALEQLRAGNLQAGIDVLAQYE